MIEPDDKEMEKKKRNFTTTLRSKQGESNLKNRGRRGSHTHVLSQRPINQKLNALKTLDIH